jgi:hypothetical protein
MCHSIPEEPVGLTARTKDRIAAAVRSVDKVIPVASNDCIFRAGCGLVALRVLHIETHMVFGGVFYRAGGDPARGTLAFAGEDGGGTLLSNNKFAGHVWLETTTGELIDFSPGDWQHAAASALIQWEVPPPDYFWGPADKLHWPKGIVAQSPPLGQAWYTGWSGPPPIEFMRKQRALVLDPPFDLLTLMNPLICDWRIIAAELAETLYPSMCS